MSKLAQSFYSIIQGMIKLLEPRIELTCLEQDVQLVNSILGECQLEFQQIIKRETTKDFKTTLSINQSQYLTEKSGKPILGGVVQQACFVLYRYFLNSLYRHWHFIYAFPKMHHLWCNFKSASSL